MTSHLLHKCQWACATCWGVAGTAEGQRVSTQVCVFIQRHTSLSAHPLVPFFARNLLNSFVVVFCIPGMLIAFKYHVPSDTRHWKICAVSPTVEKLTAWSYFWTILLMYSQINMKNNYGWEVFNLSWRWIFSRWIEDTGMGVEETIKASPQRSGH